MNTSNNNSNVHKIPQPHDSFVRRSLASMEVARDLLQAHLAPDIAQHIHWSTLQLTNKSYVKEHLAQLHSDVVVRHEAPRRKCSYSELGSRLYPIANRASAGLAMALC